MRKKRILVTGGAGFLGSHLCERLLEAGSAVLCVDNLFTGSRANVAALVDHPDFELRAHDVCEPLEGRRDIEPIDEIYHLACPASPVHYQSDPVRTIRTCVEGTLNMLALARELGATILLASTSEVYGDPAEHPQPETYWGNVNPIGPRACYDEGKRCAEALAVSYARQYGVAVRIARIFNTYGPRMQEDDGRVVSSFVVQCLRGEPITIFGDGSQTRSFCYVDDLVDGLVRLLASPASEPVNLGNPGEVTMLALAELTRELTNAKSEIVRLPRPIDDPARREPDIARAVALLGWKPQIALREGLARTIEDFRARFAHGAGLTKTVC